MSFNFPQKVLFKHCDPAGIVFYPRYFEMINDCVEAFFDAALNMPFETLHQNAGVPTAQISTVFTAPSRHGDHLSIDLVVTKIGRTSLSLSLLATCEGQSRFHALSTLVYIDVNGRPQRWPEALRDAVTPFIGEPHDI